MGTRARLWWRSAPCITIAIYLHQPSSSSSSSPSSCFTRPRHTAIISCNGMRELQKSACFGGRNNGGWPLTFSTPLLPTNASLSIQNRLPT
uniref:Putative secreted protein n=1 Tax=Anopheles darlingi TaxID=43151 RepID=A0A2M4DDV9_ANODA